MIHPRATLPPPAARLQPDNPIAVQSHLPVEASFNQNDQEAGRSLNAVGNDHSIVPLVDNSAQNASALNNSVLGLTNLPEDVKEAKNALYMYSCLIK